MVWEISRMLMLLSARYAHTLAIIPTVSFPTTVIMLFFMLFSSFPRTLLRMSSLCQVRADTNPAIEKFYFSIFLLSQFLIFLKTDHLRNLIALCHLNREITPMIRIIRQVNFHPHGLICKLRQVVFLTQMSQDHFFQVIMQHPA